MTVVNFLADTKYCPVCKRGTIHEWRNYVLVRYYVCTVCEDNAQDQMLNILDKFYKEQVK